MSYDQRLMDRCIQHALKNPIQSRGRNNISRMSALIVDPDNQKFWGWNLYKSHPMMFKFSKDHLKISLHAEIDAIVSFFNYSKSWRGGLHDCDIYVARVLKNGTPALAKPCDTCFGALTYYGIRNIYWTN